MKDFTIGRFWLVGLVGQKIAVAISNSFQVDFRPSQPPCQILSESDEKHRSWKFPFFLNQINVFKNSLKKTLHSLIRSGWSKYILSKFHLRYYLALHGHQLFQTSKKEFEKNHGPRQNIRGISSLVSNSYVVFCPILAPVPNFILKQIS